MSSGSSDTLDVYVLYTGGTIGSVGSPLAPAKMKEFTELVASQPGFTVKENRDSGVGETSTNSSLGLMVQHSDDEETLLSIDVTLDTIEPAIDSSSMTPKEWIVIARKLLRNYDGHRGLVVLHGTDTMAFTASALSYFLGRGVSKPVILTGSQVPLSKTRNDGLRNLITSVTVAATLDVPEVLLFFDNKLMRGNRSVKVSASDFPAFQSPNLAPLATAGIEIKTHKSLWLSAPSQLISLEDATNVASLERKLSNVESNFTTFSVISLVLFPGIQASTVRAMLQHTTPKVRGVILQAFGAGNAPANEELITALKDAHDDGVVLVDVTQTLMGTVDMDAYASASALTVAGSISGYDLTPEAALAKLVYLTGEGYSQKEIEAKMKDPELGDLSREVQEASDKHWEALMKKRGLFPMARHVLSRMKRKASDITS